MADTDLTNDDRRRQEQFEQQGEAYLLRGRVEEVEREQTEQKKRDEDYKQRDLAYKGRQVALEAKLVTLTGTLAALSLIGVCVAAWQTVVTQRAAGAAESAANTAVGALAESKDATQKILAQNQALNDATLSQAENLTKESLDEARRANQAAQRAAGAAERANLLATESFRQEQRADLYVSGFNLAREPDEENTTAAVVITLRNNGRSAAKAVHNFGSWGYAIGEPPPGPWGNLPEAHPTVIYPSGTYRIPVALRGFKDPLTGAALTPLQLQGVVNAYRSGKIRIYVRLRTEYLDAFDRKRWAETCVFRVFGQDPGTFFFCDTGNDFSK